LATPVPPNPGSGVEAVLLGIFRCSLSLSLSLSLSVKIGDSPSLGVKIQKISQNSDKYSSISVEKNDEFDSKIEKK
jgi:hypothetical protein